MGLPCPSLQAAQAKNRPSSRKKGICHLSPCTPPSPPPAPPPPPMLTSDPRLGEAEDDDAEEDDAEEEEEAERTEKAAMSLTTLEMRLAITLSLCCTDPGSPPTRHTCHRREVGCWECTRGGTVMIALNIKV